MNIFVPEVIQTSALDCGPAALKALLEGFGKPVSYGRLREACQTGLDGTSIDTMESVANLLGLEAEQIMLPVDHLLIPAAKALPAIVVVTLPSGVTHFVVVWRRWGHWVQVMDPAVGRRWIRAKSFLADVYRHALVVAESDWLQFAASDDFQLVLQPRLAALGIGTTQCHALIKDAAPASLDAATRFVDSLVAARGIHKGLEALRLVTRLCARPELIPSNYWSVTAEGGEQVRMRGAVLVRVKGKCAAAISTELGPELASQGAPGVELLRAFLQNSRIALPLLTLALLVAAAGTLIEALLFRGILDVSVNLGLAGQRMAAMAALLLFSCCLLLLEIPVFSTALRLGRQLEIRFRAAFLAKLPRLGDRYFQSRPISDMAERSHIIHRLRNLPDQMRRLVVSLLQLVLTAAGVVWLEPRALPLVAVTVAAALLPLFNAHFFLAERGARVRTHAGGLMRFYLDAMLGLMAVRAHGAGRTLRREHDKLLGEWAVAGLRLQRAVVAGEALQLLTMFGLVAALLLGHAFQANDIGRVLLMAYWALNLPTLGQDIATIARQYPDYRTITLRLLEPLGAPEEASQPGFSWTHAPVIDFRNVTASISGHAILSDVNLCIEAGSEVAIVGPSGAGKSSLVGLLLGWLKPSSGEILVNGSPLDCDSLRRSAAWVDPAIQLWNRSLQANLTYGSETAAANLAQTIDAAALRHVLEGLPNGLQTKLGENGGLVSGGEGQRVRFGRALTRQDARLVLLDEPFRGLDAPQRRDLLAKARQHWRGATFICVTHDLAETQTFDRVLVVEHGRIVEDGRPRDLRANTESRYAQLLKAEDDIRTQLWRSSMWRRMRLQNGRMVA